MKKNLVIYTAIFGGYDGLLPQKKFDGVDYICFTDSPIKSRTWKIVSCEKTEENLAMNARKHKILAHRYLSDYDASIYMDGNFLVKKNPSDFVSDVISKSPMAVYNHGFENMPDSRNCIYKELSYILSSKKVANWTQEDIRVMKDQVKRYKKEGYPENNGLIASGVLIRNHHHKDVVALMEAWWEELENGCVRDQLSFNYVTWKNNFQPRYLHENIRDNDYFHMIGKHRTDYTYKLLRYRLKSIFGLR